MNHDLFLRRPPNAEPLTFEEVQDLVRDDPGLSPYVNDEHTSPERLVLANPDTGAFVQVAPGGPPEGLFVEAELEEAEVEEGPGPEHDLDAPLDHLHVQIPLLWPRPFAVEGAGFAVALGKLLGWTLEDPAEPAGKRTIRDVAAVLKGWEAGRGALLAELAADPEAGEVRRLPADLLAGIHAINHDRREAAAIAGQAVLVPRLVLVQLGDEKTAGSLCRYTAGEPVWLPDAATHVLLSRKKKGFLGYKDEELVVRADELRILLGPAEKPGEAPPGRRAYHPEWMATDKVWSTIAGVPPKDAVVIDWAGVIEA